MEGKILSKYDKRAGDIANGRKSRTTEEYYKNTGKDGKCLT